MASTPIAGLVLGTDGNFYGTTTGGGNLGPFNGTVFRITPEGRLTTIYRFCSLPNCTDGWQPTAGLVQATDGNFYGTTYHGGTNNAGTVFSITPAGTLTTLYSFCSQTDCTDGQLPAAGLVQGTDGNLYGTTPVGGTNGNGTVFKITLQGMLTTLHRFIDSDGSEPSAGVVQATDGNFYGMTEFGGSHLAGTVFKITPAGTLTTLYSFCSRTNCTDGELPEYSGLIQANDGNFYGTTFQGGTHSSSLCNVSGVGACGTIFGITPAGTRTTIYDFCTQTNCLDGFLPAASLVQATNGKLYGTTFGDILTTMCVGSECGTVFGLTVGLDPFVKMLPASGAVGTTIQILGNDLEGATGVNFNGTPAVFRVMSNSYIETSVPDRATTGPVTVEVSGGTLSSNALFRVVP